MEEVSLVLPTYRLKDVAQTAEEYSKNLETHGHDIPIIVFDDSSHDIQKQHFYCLQNSKAKNLRYVGPEQKAAFIELLLAKIGTEREATVRKLLRPSYGGNRNNTALYTLGQKFISADDDMRPHGLFYHEPAMMSHREVLRGQYVHKVNDRDKVVQREFDLAGALLAVLGKKVSEIDQSNFLIGFTLVDSLTDLYTNKTVGALVPNTVTLVDGPIHPDAKIMTAQTFRTGSADVDAVDYANDFLQDPHNAFVNDMALRYVIQGFQPCITNNNWRLDCGISSYDNRDGLPPFFPTRLRFEDYMFRLWLQQDRVAAAHVNAVQTHYKNPYMRESLAHDIWNEEMANYLKIKLKERMRDITGTGIVFEGKVTVAQEETKDILAKGREFYKRALIRAAHVIDTQEKNEHLTPEQNSNLMIGFARDLYNEFSGFSTDEFHLRMQRTIDDEVTLIQDTVKVWPELLQATSEIKKEGKLPFLDMRQ
jgi:hypothetical protein